MGGGGTTAAAATPQRRAAMPITTSRTSFVKYMADATVRPNTDPLTFDFDRDSALRLARARQVYDATSFDLRRVQGSRWKTSDVARIVGCGDQRRPD